MSFVQTSVQRRAMHAPNAFGMHSEAARILAMRGVDPALFAQRIGAVGQSAHVETGALSGFSLGQEFNARPPTPGTPAPAAAGTAPLARDPRLVSFMRGLAEQPIDQIRSRFKTTFGLDPGDAVVEELLLQSALEWKNYSTLHNRICPVQVESMQAGTYFVYDRAGQRQVVDSRVGADSKSKVVSRRVSSATYTTQLRSLSGAVNRVAQALAANLNKLSSETEFVMDMHDREMELEVASALCNTANYSGDNLQTLGSTAKWNGGSAADPVQDVLDVLLAIPAEVTDAVFSDLGWSAAQINEQLQAILFGRLRPTDGVLSTAEFAQFFGIANVWISKHLVERTPGTVSRTWSETGAYFAHVDARRDMLTHARRFRAKLPGGPQGIHVRPWFDPSTPMGSDMITVTRQDSAVTFVGSDFGAFIAGIRQ
jgi:hypothetical protein